MNDGVRMSAGFNPPQSARDELAQAALFAADRRYPLEIHAYTEDGAKAILDVLDVANTFRARQGVLKACLALEQRQGSQIFTVQL